MTTEAKPIAIYYEHPDWFRPLFAELERRGTAYLAIDAARHHYDPDDTESEYSLLFNRMSPSAYLRDHGQGIFYTLNYLEHLERRGVRVINNRAAFTVETSKALQLSLLASLGLPYPRARVINHASLAVDAARDLRFPIVVKANIGGSGAGVVLYESLDSLERSAAAGTVVHSGLHPTWGNQVVIQHQGADGTAFDEDDALVALPHLRQIALDDIGLAERAGEALDRAVHEELDAAKLETRLIEALAEQLFVRHEEVVIDEERRPDAPAALVHRFAVRQVRLRPRRSAAVVGRGDAEAEKLLFQRGQPVLQIRE